MNFFDDAVNMAKDVFDIACKTTNDVVQTGKQKIDIATLENKRSKDFEALGKMYFNAIKDTEIQQLEIRLLVNDIKAKNEKIKQLREENNAEPTNHICPKCGTVLANTSQFCSFCGERQEK